MTDSAQDPTQAGAPGVSADIAPAAPLAIGATCEVAYRVAAVDSPRMLRLEDADEFPDVLSTAKMVGLMELAAARLMRPLLTGDELSVGLRVEVDHLAATPLFANVRACATYLGPEGKLHAFEVELRDDGGIAGKGRHLRAVVVPARLVEKARKRIAGQAPR